MYNFGFHGEDGLGEPIQFTTPGYAGKDGTHKATIGLSALVAFAEQVGGTVIRAVVNRMYSADMGDAYAGVVIARLPIPPDVTQWVLTSPPLGGDDSKTWEDSLKHALNQLQWGWSASGWKKREDDSWILTVRAEPVTPGVYSRAAVGINAPDPVLLAEATPEKAFVESETAAAAPAAAAAMRLSRNQKIGLGIGLGAAAVITIGVPLTAWLVKRRQEGY